VRFLESLPNAPKRVILNHGEPTAIQSLASEIRRSRDGRIRYVKIITPAVLDTITLRA
jgi:predicted metal-dependent RNase